MYTIHKYVISSETISYCAHRIPIGAKFLSVQMQKHHLCLWFVVNTEADTELRQFKVFGTGHPLTDQHNLPLTGENELTYLGTVQAERGNIILHVFEV